MIVSQEIGPEQFLARRSTDYMTKKNLRPIHVCPCRECLQCPTATTAELPAGINRVVAALDEKNRRRFVGLWASQIGHGGIQYMALVTGIERTTIRRGRREIEAADQATTQRVRLSGGGHQLVEKKTRKF